jgi:drug/metabolite transporter (DMT)-like permease
LPTIPIFLGLLSALTWGAANFGGGLAAKRTNSYGVVIVSHLGSLLILAAVTAIMREPLPGTKDLLLGLGAGMASGTGLMLLYRALAEGKMSIAAPVSSVVAAAIPVFVGSLLEAIPASLTLLGFALALGAVWLLASEQGSARANLKDLSLPILAGISFGLFFVLMAQASTQAVYWPVVAARSGSVAGLLASATLTRQAWKPARNQWPLLVLIGVVDVSGTVFYAIATQFGRLDVTAVLGSLYPGATVLLAWVFLKERISRTQLFGILLALGAIILLTL